MSIKKSIAHFERLIKGGATPSPSTGEDEIKKPTKDAPATPNTQGKPDGSKVDPSRPDAGKGAKFANGDDPNAKWESLGKATVKTPWGEQIAQVERYKGTTLGKALVTDQNGTRIWKGITFADAAPAANAQPPQPPPSGDAHPDEDEDKKLFEQMFEDKMQKGAFTQAYSAASNGNTAASGVSAPINRHMMLQADPSRSLLNARSQNVVPQAGDRPVAIDPFSAYDSALGRSTVQGQAANAEDAFVQRYGRLANIPNFGNTR